MDRLYGIALSLMLTGICGFARWYSLKTGECRLRGAVIYRKKSPRAFQFMIGMYTIFAVVGVLSALAVLFGLLPIQ